MNQTRKELFSKLTRVKKYEKTVKSKAKPNNFKKWKPERPFSQLSLLLSFQRLRYINRVYMLCYTAPAVHHTGSREASFSHSMFYLLPGLQ